MQRKSTNSLEEMSPGVQSFARPDPEAAGDADGETHEVFQHQDGEVGVGELAPGQTTGADVAQLPVLEGDQLVDGAGDDCPSRDDVEDGEYSDLHHQLLQLVNLGSAALLLDHVTDLEEADEAGGEKGDAQEEVDELRDDDEAQETGRRPGADLTDAGHGVALHC